MYRDNKSIVALPNKDEIDGVCYIPSDFFGQASDQYLSFEQHHVHKMTSMPLIAVL